VFRRIVDTPRATLHTGARTRTVVNHNDLVGEVPWINGVKTGYTPAAGYVLVGSGTRKGVTLISVVMGARTIAARDDDTLALLRYGFSLYRLERAIRPGQTLDRARVVDGERNVPLVAGHALRATVRRGQRARVRVHAPGSVPAPIHRGERIGRATVTVGDQNVGNVPLVAGRSVRAVEADSLAARADDLLPGPRAAAWGLVGVLATAAVVGVLVATRRRE
jgi:D-alanyl-D-alanine carboxypeptidase (penicillin-binding protein 5/6)